MSVVVKESVPPAPVVLNNKEIVPAVSNLNNTWSVQFPRKVSVPDVVFLFRKKHNANGTVALFKIALRFVPKSIYSVLLLFRDIEHGTE